MPYSDPKKAREAARLRYAARFASDPEFREKEAARKAKWLAEKGQESNRLASKRWIRKKKREEEG